MGRTWLWTIAWPVLLLFYLSSVLKAVAKDYHGNNSDNKAQLKVDIRKDTLVGAPSCQHTFTQMELLNLHTTDPIIIHSIWTTPEETVLVRSESGVDEGRKWENHLIPQQIHVSKLPPASLSLGPGQVAIVPVTFLPRFPDMDEEKEKEPPSLHNNRRVENEMIDPVHKKIASWEGDRSSSPPISSAAIHDLVDMVGDERILQAIDKKRLLTHTMDPAFRRRNNVDPSSLPSVDVFEVSTTVIVDTSRGIVKLPVTVSSVRDNLYQIPDTIRFHHPRLAVVNKDSVGCNAVSNVNSDNRTSNSESLKGCILPSNLARFFGIDHIVILDTIHVNDAHSSTASVSTTQSTTTFTPGSDKECFDLYLSNPSSDRELKIGEALVSKPDLVGIQFDPSRVLGVPEFNLLVATGPSQVIRRWSQEGPLYLPPDSDDNYILSICTAAPNEVERDSHSESYLDEITKWIDTGNQGRNLGFLQIRTDKETLFIALEQSDGSPYLALNNFSRSSDGRKNIGRNYSNDLRSSNKSATSTALLKPFPGYVEFSMLSRSSLPIQMKIGLQNKSPVPIRIMRVTSAINCNDDRSTRTEVRALGLSVEVAWSSYGADDDHQRELDSVVLGPASSVSDVLTLNCSIDPNPLELDSSKDVYMFNGTVIVRGTIDTDITYNEWLQATLQNPYRDEHLTIEVPFSISILNGRVEAIIDASTHPFPHLFAGKTWDKSSRGVSHLFFPLNPTIEMPTIDDSFPREKFQGSSEVRHDLRILSNMAFPIKLEGVQIEDNDERIGTESLCKRFNVSIIGVAEAAEVVSGFVSIGYLELKYKFGPTRKSYMVSASDPVLPKRCLLKMYMSPKGAGSLVIPLEIFPGHLEVTSSDSQMGSDNFPDSSVSAAIVGFAGLQRWCKSSRVGRAFLDLLQHNTEENPKKDSKLLSSFIENMVSHVHSAITYPQFVPIVVVMGAVDHGEVAKTYLYFTNHNPIPISVSIDVGEVGGSSIRLNREASLTNGDGNSLLDYVPKHGSEAMVEKGFFADSPVNGLLEFLKSDDVALKFLSEFNFRDSISPHDPSLEKDSVLRSLHDWHSFATFHRELLFSRTDSDKSHYNTDGLHPPEYTFQEDADNVEILDHGTKAFIMTSDQKFVKSLNVSNENSLPSQRKDIKIPPGARARFVLLVRAPPQPFLVNDISQLLSTGLILSTNLGNVMPIFASFEALQGQLHVSNTNGFQNHERIEFGPQILRYSGMHIVNVPLELSWEVDNEVERDEWEETRPIAIPSLNATVMTNNLSSVPISSSMPKLMKWGVPLFLKSSFARTVKLIKLESCNPWFTVTPAGPYSEALQIDSLNGVVHVGYVGTTVDCLSHDADVDALPTYYQCLFNWLSNRVTLQSEGCGLGLLSDSNLDLRRIENVKIAIRDAISISHATYGTDWSDYSAMDFYSPKTPNLAHVKTGHRREDGVIANFDFHTTSNVAFEVVRKYGYNWLSSSLKATVEYDTSLDTQLESSKINQNITLMIHDLALKTVLEPPRLYHSTLDASNILHFESTPVSMISNAFVPLHNPTGVAIKVRLAISTTEIPRTSRPDRSPSSWIQAPHVQNVQHSGSSNRSNHQLWWEGEGGYFIHDPHGDLIRSRQNITIKAGAGAIVSLVNPSLHAQVGLLSGCARRCGLRDENQQSFDYNVAYSPLGASAAAGVTLTGRLRSSSPHANIGEGPEPMVLSGGIPVPGTGGPVAFAIPYSSLDEIVIPPHGKGLLGPIYFRPPGRYHALGCDLSKKSGGRLSHGLCGVESFESFIYLENSLTGFEKVVLEGRSLWSHVYFTDPIVSRGIDSYGDIENRNGRPTLLFELREAQSSFLEKPGPASITKETILYNGGDTVASIISVGLDGVDGSHSCACGTFRLQSCWPGKKSSMITHDHNIYEGFTLKPGENRSIFVDYFPDCSKSHEYVNLVVTLRTHAPNKGAMSHERMLSRHPQQRNSFEVEEIMLQLGSEMKDISLLGCMRESSIGRGDKTSIFLSVEGFLLLNALLLLCFALRTRFYALWSMLQKMPTYKPFEKVKEPYVRVSRSHWNVVFRCLARADPSSAELQALSREQMRQVVTGLYNARGSAPPLAINSSSGFTRDRRLFVYGTRHKLGKDGGGGGDRIRTLSDAIFQEVFVSDNFSARNQLPTKLGWRIACARGILKEASFGSICVQRRESELRKLRISATDEKEEEQDEISTEEEQFNEEETTPTMLTRNCHAQRDETRGRNSGLAELETAEGLSVVSTSESEGTYPSRPSNCTANEGSDEAFAPYQGLLQCDEGNEKYVNQEVSKMKSKKAGSPLNPNLSSDEAKVKPRIQRNQSKESRTNSKVSVETPVCARQKKQTEGQRDPPTPSDGMVKNAENRPLHSHRGLEPTRPIGKSRAGNVESLTQTMKGTIGGSKINKYSSDENSMIKESSIDNWTITPLRPPPGLAPPPGFSDSPLPTVTFDRTTTSDAFFDKPMSPDSMLGAGTTGLLDSTTPMALSSSPAKFSFNAPCRDDILMANHVGGGGPKISTSTRSGDFDFMLQAQSSPILSIRNPSVPMNQGETNLIHSQHTPIPVPHNEESQSGFDILDFLDSVLNEGCALDETEEKNLKSKSIEESATLILSNPWASEGKSRASAYGISFDEDDDGSSTGSIDMHGADKNFDRGGIKPGLARSSFLLTPTEGDDVANHENDVSIRAWQI